MNFYHLYIGDSREVLKKIPQIVKLTVTSPPYAWEFRYEGKEKQLGEIWDTKKFFQELHRVWRLVFEATIPGGYLAVVWADIPDAAKLYGHYRIENLAAGMVWSVEKAGFYLVSEWIWRKYEPGAAVSIRPYRAYEQMKTGNYIPASAMNWEYVFVWRKPGAKLLPCFDVKEDEWYPTYLDGVWDIKYDPKIDKDPACFPLELAKRLIKIYSRPGDVILDPFLGSGTTMLAARLLGRSCIGVEVDESRLPRIREKVGWNQSLGGEEFRIFR